MKKTIIIAEAGVNHCGKLSIAKKMIISAKKIGADYIKFQTAIPEHVVSEYAKKANYQKRNNNDDESQLKMIQKNQL